MHIYARIPAALGLNSTCVPCGAPATGVYHLRAGGVRQVLVVRIHTTLDLPVPRCARKRLMARALLTAFGLVAALFLPIVVDGRAYSGTLDDNLIILPMTVFAGLILGHALARVGDRLFMPLAAVRYDAPENAALFWVRNGDVAARLLRAYPAEGSCPPGRV